MTRNSFILKVLIAMRVYPDGDGVYSFIIRKNILINVCRFYSLGDYHNDNNDPYRQETSIRRYSLSTQDLQKIHS